VDELELATLDWVDWWNRDRLHGSIGHVPPIELQAEHYR
jgi:putative transposase